MNKILAKKNDHILMQLEFTLENGEPLYSVGSVEYFAGRDESECFKCTKPEMLQYLRKSLKGYEKNLEKAREWHMDTRIPMLNKQIETMQLFINVLERKGSQYV